MDENSSTLLSHFNSYIYSYRSTIWTRFFKIPILSSKNYSKFYGKWLFSSSVASLNRRVFLLIDAILLGFIIAHYQVFFLKNKKIILSLLIILIPLYLLNFNFFVDGNKTAYIRFLFILFMQLLSAVVMLGFVLLEPIILNNNLKKFSLFISQQAYSIYLLHMIFIYIFKELNYSVLISSILYIMILFFTSTLVYKYFEEPIMKLRPKIL